MLGLVFHDSRLKQIYTPCQCKHWKFPFSAHRNPRRKKSNSRHAISAQPLFQLLLGAELVGVSALLLAAVGRTRGKTGLFNESIAGSS
jgi:hypothetical protein